MPREPDPVTDGAFSLLSLSNQRDIADPNNPISNLSPVVASVSAPAAPAHRAQNALDLLEPSGTTASLARTAPLSQKNSLESAPHPLLYDPGGAGALAEQVRSDNQQTPSNLDAARLKTSVPRLPSLSNSEGRTHNDTLLSNISETNVSRSPRTHIPSLARLSEWAPSGSPSISNSVPPLLRLNPLNLPRMPAALPPLTSQPSADYRQPSWIRSNVPSIQVPFQSTATPVVHDFHPHSSPSVFSMPVPQPASQSGVDYYYQPNAQSQYMNVSLPQIRPPRPPPPRLPIPAYSSSNFRTTLSPPSLGQASFTSQNLSHGNALPPIMNQLDNSIASEENTAACGDTVQNPFPPLATETVAVSQTVKSEPVTKSMFKGPASSGRGFINLMNPTDTLATVASSSEPLPVEDVKIELPTETRKSQSAKMKMARELFGTGDDLVPHRGQKELSRQRIQDARSPSDKVLTPLMNGKVRSSGKDVEKIKLDSRITTKNSPKANTKKRSIDKESPQFSEQGIRKNGRSLCRVIESDDDDDDQDDDEDEDSDSDSECDEDIDDSSEVTRCPCGLQADSGTMIACDQCNTWQHRICMGFRRKSEVPKRYYCHICRPDDIRTNCVAHPKFKERMAMKDEEDRCEPILLSVKPLELRRLFMADLRLKREGTRKAIDLEVFKRYARLYRSHFGKDRQSVIEGLVVLTERPRNDVVNQFDYAAKKIKKESFDSLNILPNSDQPDRKKIAVSLSNSPVTTPIDNVAPMHQRSLQKRARSALVSHENSMESTDFESRQHDVTPDKEISQGERNRLSREERKNLQVMSLFKKMDDRERDKKRPRYGEPSSSPRSSTLASPRSMGASSARSGLSPTSSVKLAPSVHQRSSEQPTTTDDRNVISIDVSQYEAGSHISIPKRERSVKEKKDMRRKDTREFIGDSKRPVGIFSNRRQRQTLSSVGVRKRGKSDSRFNIDDIDPTLRVDVKVPGVSVIGSALVPRARRSRLVNDALDESEKALKIASAVRSSFKERIKSSQKLQDVTVSAKLPPIHPLRKRLSEIQKVEDKLLSSKADVMDTEMTENYKDTEMVSLDRSPEPVAGHDRVARDYSLKKRMLIRSESKTAGSTDPVSRSTESPCFRKRLLRSGPSKVVAKPQFIATSKVISKAKVNSKLNLKSAKVTVNKPMKETPASERKSEIEERKLEKLELELRESESTKAESKEPDAPAGSEERTEKKMPVNANTKPSGSVSVVVRPVPVVAAPLNVPIRSEKVIPPNINIPSRSLSSSPVPNSFRTPPPVRTTVVNRETKSGPGKLGGSVSSVTTPGTSFRAVPSPPLRSVRSPQVPARAPFPLRSKPVGPLKVNGQSTTVKIDNDESGLATASDILQSRLQGFLSQSKKPVPQVVIETPAPSPRIPKSVPVMGLGRHSRGLNTANPSPRIGGMGMKPKYGGSGPPGSWRSFDGPKRVVASAGSTGMGGRIGDKPKSEGRMRGNGTRMNKVNGSSNAGTSAWSQYRRQNGWAPVTGGKHVSYSAPNGPSSSHDGKSNGRRRPYG